MFSVPFDIHNGHFVVMTDYGPHSSEELPHVYQKGSEQYNFVKNDLTQSVVNPEIYWIIALRHVQEYASTLGKMLLEVDE
jgi:hypothetical protein